MATLKQTLPASLRSSSLTVLDNHGHSAQDHRPYLVTAPTRKPVASTWQYTALFPHESEDARITGTTRSLHRRLLALNLPDTEAGIEMLPEVKREVRPISVSVATHKIA